MQATATLADALVNAPPAARQCSRSPTAVTGYAQPKYEPCDGAVDAATNLTLSKMVFITAIGEAASNSITAAATNQTLERYWWGDTLTSYSGFGDVFLGLSAGLNGDTIVGSAAPAALPTRST